jgi:DNA uptake protein ComE-like DNA-binding protein
MRRDSQPREGSILLLVLLAIVIMSLATASYLTLMRNEHRATRNAGQQFQARMLVESGSDYLCVFLDQTDLLIAQQGGVLTNPDKLQGQLVVDDLNQESRGRFTIVAPDMIDGYYSGFRYGLEDESSKLDLNLLAAGDGDEEAVRSRLMFIPGMTEDVADAILDWIDSDNQPRAYGAEDTYYQGLSPPRVPTNAPLRSLSELLQVRGVTPELLYGLDANRSLKVDESEVARGVLTQIDNSLGQINRGWSAYFTVYAAERTLSPTGTATGTAKININNSDLRTLQTELQQVVDAETANFILAYRQFGPAAADAQGTGGNASSLTINLDTPATTQINSLLDLVGAKVSVQQNPSGQQSGQTVGGQNGSGQQNQGGQQSNGVPGQSGGVAQIVESPWQDSAALYSGVFLNLLDKLTTTDEPARGGRVNINLASRPVLLSIPGLTEMQADQILTMRESALDRQTSPQRHAVWLLANAVVTLEEMKALDSFVTTGGDVYSGQIVGFFDGQPATARCQITWDRTDTTTLVVGWEDLSDLGPGFSPEDLGAAVITK